MEKRDVNKCRFNCDGGCRVINNSHQKAGYSKCFGCDRKCTLFQTEEEQKLSLHKAWTRFLSLPKAQQAIYKSLYYYGKNPWEVLL